MEFEAPDLNISLTSDGQAYNRTRRSVWLTMNRINDQRSKEPGSLTPIAMELVQCILSYLRPRDKVLYILGESTGCSGKVMTIAWHRGLLYVGTNDGYIRIYNSTYQCLTNFKAHCNEVLCLTILPKPNQVNHLYSGCYDGTISVWSLHHLPTTACRVVTLYNHTDRVRALLHSRDGTKLFSASSDNTIRVYDICNNHEQTSMIIGLSTGISSLSLYYSVLLYGSTDGHIRGVDLTQPEFPVVISFGAHSDVILSMTVDQEDDKLYSCSYSPIRVWHLASMLEQGKHKMLMSIPQHTWNVCSIVKKQQKLFLCSSMASDIKVYQL